MADQPMTLDEFCGQFGMVPAEGLDGSQTVDNFLADTDTVANRHEDPAAVKAFLDDPSVSDDVKFDAFIRAMVDGEGDTEAIKHALADYATV